MAKNLLRTAVVLIALTSYSTSYAQVVIVKWVVEVIGVGAIVYEGMSYASAKEAKRENPGSTIQKVCLDAENYEVPCD